MKNKKAYLRIDGRMKTSFVIFVFFIFFFSFSFFSTLFGWKGGMTPPAFIRFERDPKYAEEEDPKAVFPHLLHEEIYQCFTCHPSIFPPETGYLNHSYFDEGKFCAVCHNGKISFSHEDSDFCEKCHIGGE